MTELLSDHALMYVIAVCCIYECIILTLEYKYDAAKDAAKKQKRTRTTKKTTTAPTGEVVTEEHTETVESKGNGNAHTEETK